MCLKPLLDVISFTSLKNKTPLRQQYVNKRSRWTEDGPFVSAKKENVLIENTNYNNNNNTDNNNTNNVL